MSGSTFPTYPGEKCDKIEIVPILIKHGTLVTNWRILYNNLLPGEEGRMVQLDRGFRSQCTTDYELFMEIISMWIGRQGNAATTKCLEKSLRSIGEEDAADAVAKFQNKQKSSK